MAKNGYEVSGYLVRTFTDAQRAAAALRHHLELADLPEELAGCHIPAWVILPPDLATWHVLGERGGENMVDPGIISSHELRPGDHFEGVARGGQLIRVTQAPPLGRVPFLGDGAPPVQFPTERYHLATGTDGAGEKTRRVIDLIAPIGKGTRGLIVSPPKAGKSVVVQQVAHGITVNHPEAAVWVVLVDERPEEADTADIPDDVRPDLLPGFVGPKVRIFASTFDKDSPEGCVRMVERVFEQAKQYVLGGGDLVIILDSLTRLARIYNAVLARTWEGGYDQGGVIRPAKTFAGRIYGLARSLPEPYGSLTIVATAYTGTVSRFDDAIREEFIGRGNLDVFLDLDMARAHVWPAVNIGESETRNVHLLYPKQWEQVLDLRKMLLRERGPERQMEKLLALIEQTPSNEELLKQIAGGVQRAAKDEAFQNFINAAAGVRALTNQMAAFRAAFGVVGLKPPEAVTQFVKSLPKAEQEHVRALLEKEGLVATANSAPPPPPPPKKRVDGSKKAGGKADDRSEAEKLRDVGIPPEQAGLPA